MRYYLRTLSSRLQTATRDNTAASTYTSLLTFPHSSSPYYLPSSAASNFASQPVQVQGHGFKFRTHHAPRYQACPGFTYDFDELGRFLVGVSEAEQPGFRRVSAAWWGEDL